MTLIFPSWTEYLEEVYSPTCKSEYNFPREVNLAELLGALNFCAENEEITREEPFRMADLIVNNGHLEVNFTEVSEEKLFDNLIAINLGVAQFIVVGNASTNQFIKVDNRIKDVLGIEPEEFTLPRICGLDVTHELFHPDDIPHVLRLTTFLILIANLKGIRIDPYQDYYKVKFRIGYSDDASKYTIERKIYLSSKCNVANELIHFDVWTKTHDWDRFEGVHLIMESPDYGKRNFVSMLVFVLNAIKLGFSPKEILLLRVVVQYKSNYIQLQAYNSLFEDEFNQNKVLLTDNQFKHKKRYLVKKIERAFLSDVHPLSDKRLLEDANFHFKASQLGLVHAPECFEKIVLNWIRRESPLTG